MPHFTLQIGDRGPIVPAVVTASGPRLQALRAARLPAPIPQRTLALLDTGASCTCLDPAVLDALALTPRGTAEVSTVSTGRTPQTREEYEVALIIPAGIDDESGLVFETVAVVSAELFAVQGIHALIGRDVLERCLLVYNGADDQFTLAY